MIARACLGAFLSGLLCTTSLTGCRKRGVPEPREATVAPPPPSEPTPPSEPGAGKAQVDRFADLRLLRLTVPGFEGLPLRQKLLLYFLGEAALSGRDITYDQLYEHNLAVRRTLEAVLTSYAGSRDDPAFTALVTYAKRVWFSNGIHHHYSSRKFVPEGLTPAELARFVRSVPNGKLPLSPGETVDRFLEKLTPIVFDPARDARGVNRDPGMDAVRDSATHFYVRLGQDEVRAYHRQHAHEGDPAPPSIGINSQLVKRDNGTIEERAWKVAGMYGPALAACVRWLERALTVAESDAQRDAITKLITFYRSGDPRAWDTFNIAWLGDDEGRVDFIHGFVETYDDPLALRGTYEALVELEDSAASARIRTLSREAQWFEDHSPIDPAHKKTSVVGIKARVVEAVVAAGSTAPTLPSGINLPNAAWIREQHGSKSVTLANVLAAYDAEQRDNGVLEEFAASSRELSRARQHGAQARALMVDMHEVIGHASGRLLTGVPPVSATLGGYANTIEEARADLVALYYLLDPRLIELKLLPSLEVGRAAYDALIRGALVVQLAQVPLGEPLEEAHMRGRMLIAKWALTEGASEQVIERSERNGKTYYAIRDYVRLRKLFGRLLRELQRIESEGDLAAARKLVEELGVTLDPTLHREVRARYELLGVAPYAGFVQPKLTPVLGGEKGDEIVDVRIEYPTDFVAQQLEYAERYSFLPTYN